MKSTIKNTFAALSIAAFALLGSATTSDAAAFMKLGDIKGEATDNEHKDWIIIESMSSPIFRAMTTDSTTGVQRRRGDVILDDISCTKELDKSSPKIAEAICIGTVYPEVEIHFCIEVPNTDGTLGTRQEPYLTYKLKDVIVTSYSFHGNAAGDPLPTEEITLGYTEVEWTYITVDPKTGDKGAPVTGHCIGTGSQS